VASKRRFLLILALPLFLVIFNGGAHHFCEFHCQACSLPSHADSQPLLILPQTGVFVITQHLPVAPNPISAAEILAEPVAVWTPLQGRAPPLAS